MFSEPKLPGGRIRVLPPQLAQKIAAGEVIERPQSVVRELLDNAIDSGSTTIDLTIEDGGSSRMIVQDDGCGMDRENVSLSWLPHATSKITVESDLYDIHTLGFRGEALSSIATVALLMISSSTGSDGAVLEVHGGELIRLDPFQGKTGTRVEVRNLFYNLPARKQFLKRSATESTMCKNVLIDKALAHPKIAFRFSTESGMVLYLAACSGETAFKDRYRAVFPEVQTEFLHELSVSFPEGHLRLIIGGPELYQHDRRSIQIFINGRRVNEFGLVQAIEYGFTGFLPGGRFPVAACFLEINPQRLDVNIHPAKREVKIRDLPLIHSQIVRTIQNFLRTFVHRQTVFEHKEIQLPLPVSATSPNFIPNRPALFGHISNNSQNSVGFDRSIRFDTAAVAETAVPFSGQSEPTFRYLGLVFGVFLIVVVDGSLLMMDMHAAHERILFDRFRADGKRQDLLLQLEFAAENADADQALAELRPDLATMGIRIEPINDGRWLLASLPACFTAKSDIVIEILENPALYRENLERSLFATLACRSAIKDGDTIGHEQAISLIREALALPEQRCPHGRPIFFALSKDELFELVGRKV